MNRADSGPHPLQPPSVAFSEPSQSFARTRARLKLLTVTERARLEKLLREKAAQARKARKADPTPPVPLATERGGLTASALP